MILPHAGNWLARKSYDLDTSDPAGKRLPINLKLNLAQKIPQLELQDDPIKAVKDKAISHMLKHGNRSKVGHLISMEIPDGYQQHRMILDKDKYTRRVNAREASEYNR